MSSIIDKLFRDKTNSTIIQLFRYAFVGGIAFFADYGVMVFLTEFFGIYHIISASIGFIVGLTVNYLLSIIWVFDVSTKKNKWAEFSIFTLIGIIGLILNAGIIYLFSDIIGLDYKISKLISTALVFLWNFFARKIILFTNNTPK